LEQIARVVVVVVSPSTNHTLISHEITFYMYVFQSMRSPYRP